MRDQYGNLTRKAYPYEFWVNKTKFIDAVMAGMTEARMSALNENPLVTMAIAYLPGEELDILDQKVAMFLAMAGTDVNTIMERMELEFPPDPTKPEAGDMI